MITSKESKSYLAVYYEFMRSKAYKIHYKHEIMNWVPCAPPDFPIKVPDAIIIRCKWIAPILFVSKKSPTTAKRILESVNLQQTISTWDNHPEEIANVCPVCGYDFEKCQCMFSGSCHPDRSKKREVVLDHLYLLTPEQIQHLANLQKLKQISYTDPEKEEFLRKLEETSIVKGTIS